MADIVVNFSMLDRLLSKVVDDTYKHLGKTYLVIENLDIQTEELGLVPANSERLTFDYYINGRYGIEGVKDMPFEFLASSTWDYNFLAGYFARILDEQDEQELRED